MPGQKEEKVAEAFQCFFAGEKTLFTFHYTKYGGKKGRVGLRKRERHKSVLNEA